MCGIAGLITCVQLRDRDPAVTARKMADTLAHRGPDGSDAWGDAEPGSALATVGLRSSISLYRRTAQCILLRARYVITS